MRKEFRLKSIELYNVFNYRGRNVIDFTTDRDGNVFLFNIKNGGGKTSLFLGIKWGFYGFDSNIIYEKDGVRLRASDFMNQDEREEGRFMVKINFLYDGQHMELRRECPDYRSDGTKLTLRVQGIMESGAKAREHVAQIIPPDYGDFFMFNGEVLQEIANNQRDSFKAESVQRLMGLRQLNELSMVLKSVQRSMSDEFSAIKGVGSEVSELMSELERLQDKDSRLKGKRVEIEGKLEESRRRIGDLEERRRSYGDIEAATDRLTTLRKKEGALMSERESLMSDISQRCSSAYLIFIEEDIAGVKQKLDEKVSSIESEMRSIPGNKGEYLHLQSRIIKQHLNECPVCGSMISDEAMSLLESIVEKSTGKGERFEALSLELADLRPTRQAMTEAINRIPRRLIENCDKLYDANEKLIKVRSDIERLEDMFQTTSDVEALKDISQELTEEYRTKAGLDEDLFQNGNLIRNTEKKLVGIRRRLKETEGLGGRHAALARQMFLIDGLVKGLDVVIKQVTKAKRKDILDRANDVFMSITNKPDVYRGLSYDNDRSFSMHIVRNDGATVLHPSSGEKHVMAISFLISLSLNSERLNPMMMDTPLSRLDPVHKANIGRTLASLDNQVLFLAQPGEMDDETLRMFLPSVVKMYESIPAEDNRANIVEVRV